MHSRAIDAHFVLVGFMLTTDTFLYCISSAYAQLKTQSHQPRTRPGCQDGTRFLLLLTMCRRVHDAASPPMGHRVAAAPAVPGSASVEMMLSRGKRITPGSMALIHAKIITEPPHVRYTHRRRILYSTKKMLLSPRARFLFLASVPSQSTTTRATKSTPDSQL